MDATEPRTGWPLIGWNTAPLLPTFSSTNPCNTSPGKFAHPFDRSLYRNISLMNTKVVGVENVASDHYGLLTTFQLATIQPIRQIPFVPQSILPVRQPSAPIVHVPCPVKTIKLPSITRR